MNKHSATLASVLTFVLAAAPVVAQPTGEPPKAPVIPKIQAPALLPPSAIEPLLKLDHVMNVDHTMKLDHVMTLAHDAAMLADRHQGLIADAELMASKVTLLHDFSLDLVASAHDQESAEARQKEREAELKERERERESRVYEDAMRARDESRWERAIERFNDVVTMKGSRADAAMYWKAYSQDRLGQRAEALTTIAALERDYPKSRYLKDAKALEAEVRRNAGQPVRPQDQADEDLKLMAIAALQHQAPEEAVPMLEKLLAGPSSPKLKERALFVLAQSDSPRARDVLRNIAKGGSIPELQSRAISYLGTHGGRESRAVLAEVYSSSSDVDVKKRILRAFMVAGEKDRLFTAAQSEQNAELRAVAVQQLGVMGAHAELSQLYQKESSVDIKKAIIQAMFVGGNSTRMTELAKGEPNPELRRVAIRNLGLMGSKGTSEALVDIYNTDKDVTVRKAVINALFLQNNATALVALARKETDLTIKKEIVQRLSTMNSKVATDYMLELLNK
jgi:HEAT repeat protein